MIHTEVKPIGGKGVVPSTPSTKQLFGAPAAKEINTNTTKATSMFILQANDELRRRMWELNGYIRRMKKNDVLWYAYL